MKSGRNRNNWRIVPRPRLAILLAASLASALVAGAFTAPAGAATLPANCSNFGTTLAGAGTGDTIVLSGLCTGASASFTLPATANLTIQGAAIGTNGFDGTGVGTPALTSGNSPNDPDGLTLRNLTFRNYASSSAVNVTTQKVANPFTFAGNSFSRNSNPTGDGGGLHFEAFNSSCPLTGPTVTISGSSFDGNSAGGRINGATGAEGGGGGGASIDLECAAGTPAASVTDNTFTGNTVPAGTGIFRGGGALIADIGYHGPAVPIALNQSGNLVSGNSITGIGKSFAGGGEFTFGYNITSSGDRFVSNSIPGSTSSTFSSEGGGLSSFSGGACATTPGVTSRATNLVAAGNTIGAPVSSGNGGEGGGIYAGCNAGTGGYDLTLVNSTVSGNVASGPGASAGADGETTDSLHLFNTILTGNSGAADLGGFGASDGANVSAQNSDVCAIGTAAPFAGAGNICAAAALASPGPGAADVHETAASPTIDAGSNALIGATPTDAFDTPRIQPRFRGDAAIVDIGAAEFPEQLRSNNFKLGKVKGKSLIVFVDSPGTLDVVQGPAGGREAVASRKRTLLKHSSASGGPGKVSVRLRLSKAAKATLKKKHKLKIKAKVTFTPRGGNAKTQGARLKLKKKH